MNKIRCDFGHYYDADVYAICPHCTKEPQTDRPAKKAAPEIPGLYLTPPSAATLWKQDPANKTEISFPKQDSAPVPLPHNDEAIIAPEVPVPVRDDEEAGQERIVPPVSEDVQREISLKTQVESVVSGSPVTTDDTKTTAFYNLSEIEPVVGWLVCVKGSYLGQGFTLKTGRNNIGRSMTMDVPLAQEPSVSRNTHAAIIYEPNDRVFYLRAGESNGLTYLNRELVITHTIINAHDHIRLGECEFIFIPCCDERFTWSDYI